MFFCPGATTLINQGRELPTARIFIWPWPEILSLQPCDLQVPATPLLNGVSSFEGVEIATAVCSTLIALTRCRHLPIICSRSDTPRLFFTTNLLSWLNYIDHNNPRWAVPLHHCVICWMSRVTTQQAWSFLTFISEQISVSPSLSTSDVFPVTSGCFPDVPQESKPCFLDLRRIGLILIKWRLLNLSSSLWIGLVNDSPWIMAQRTCQRKNSP